MSNGHSQKDKKMGFQDQLLLNAGQKYCRMLQGEHSAILLIFIKLPFAKCCHPHKIKSLLTYLLLRSLFVYFLVAVLHRFYCIQIFGMFMRFISSSRVKIYIPSLMKYTFFISGDELCDIFMTKTLIFFSLYTL